MGFDLNHLLKKVFASAYPISQMSDITEIKDWIHSKYSVCITIRSFSISKNGVFDCFTLIIGIYTQHYSILSIRHFHPAIFILLLLDKER